jgi:signal peptidase
MTALPIDEHRMARATSMVARAELLVPAALAGIGAEAWLVTSGGVAGLVALAPVALVLAATAPAVAGAALRLATRVRRLPAAAAAEVQTGATMSARFVRDELLVPFAILCWVGELVVVAKAPQVAIPALVPFGIGLAWTAQRLVRSGARRALRSCQSAVICIAAAFLLAVGILPHFGVYRTLTALSNSMQPAFSAGDVLVVRPEPLSEVRAGQVLALQLPNGGRVETHRVVRVVRAGAHPVVEDATKEPDPWGRIMLTGTTAWRMTHVVPKVGYVVHAFRTPLFHLLGLYVCPALLALLALLDVWDVPARLRRLRPGAVVLRPPPETVPTQ